MRLMVAGMGAGMLTIEHMAEIASNPIVELLLAGFGVGLVPRSVAAAAGAKVRVRALAQAIRPANRPAVVWLPNRPDARLSDAFRAALTEAATAGKG